MAHDDRRRDLRLLGLDDEANEAEVLAAYHRRRALYDAENLATYSLLADDERQQVLAELEAALVRLTALSPPPQPAPKPPPPAARRPEPPVGPEPERGSSPGAYLRYHRLAQGISLGEVARDTKIAEPRLEAIESEIPDNLPEPVYVRGFVVNLARLLGLPDPEGLARAYLDKIQGSACGLGNKASKMG